MLFVEERTPKEIAGQMDCSLQHVYKQRSQALKQLKQMLEKGGVENE
jgi:DNA-directed RNA polymerase specialized sigma24 family protein